MLGDVHVPGPDLSPFGWLDSISPTSDDVCPMSSSTEQSSAPTRRHAPTAVERQRIQLDKLLKDPAKAAYIPPPPKDKTIRPPREMMKNVQGSSAGAGSGEFHVYKAGRRREYERLKLLDETSQKVCRTVHDLKFRLPGVDSFSQESEQADFERRKREADEAAEAKTAKNRAKRQKKKERAKGKGPAGEHGTLDEPTDLPAKKRRLS